MKSIKNKLKSNTGASVIMALGLFLICTMISSVIVIAAVSGSTRNVERMESQKEYLSISSAAQLMVDELESLQGKKYIGREEKTICECSDYTTKEYFEFSGTGIWGYRVSDSDPGIIDVMFLEKCQEEHWKKITYKSDAANSDNVLLDLKEGLDQKDNIEFLILEAAEEIYLYERNGYEKEFTITMPDTESRLLDVKCKFIMEKDYSITIELTMENSSYAITLSMDSMVTLPPEENGGVNGTIMGARNHEGWYKKDIDGNGDFDIVNGSIEFETSTPYKTTTVIWNKPKLMKGGTETW